MSASQVPPEGIDPFTLGAYIPLFEHLARVDGVTHAHCRVYGTLAAFRGKGQGNACAPSMKAVCARLGTRDERTVRKLISELEQFGLIAVDRSDNGQGKPSRYYFLPTNPRGEMPRGSNRPGGEDDPGGNNPRTPRGEMPRGPRGKTPRTLKTLIKTSEDKTEGERASARPQVSGAHIQEFSEALRAESFALDITPPSLPHSQLRQVAERAKDHAERTGKPYAEAARDLVRSGLEAKRAAPSKQLGFILLDIEPGRPPLQGPGVGHGGRQLSPLALKAIEDSRREESRRR